MFGHFSNQRVQSLTSYMQKGAQFSAGCETWIVLVSFAMFSESNLK